MGRYLQMMYLISHGYHEYHDIQSILRTHTTQHQKKKLSDKKKKWAKDMNRLFTKEIYS